MSLYKFHPSTINIKSIPKRAENQLIISVISLMIAS